MTNFITAIVILVVIALIAIYVLYFNKNATYTVVEPDEEGMELLQDYRSQMINDMIEHLQFWFKWDPEEVRTSGGVTPEDQGKVRLVHNNTELFLTFKWKQHKVIIQYVDYDEENEVVFRKSKTFSFKDNQLRWDKIHTFANDLFNHDTKHMKAEEILSIALGYAVQIATNPEKAEQVEPVFFESVLHVYEYVAEHQIKDKKIIRALAGLVCYCAKNHKEEFVKHLKDKIDIDEEEDE